MPTRTPKRPVRFVNAAVTATILAASCFLGNAAQAQTYMNMTVGGQFAPGVFGQISIGSAPPPPVINAQPVIVGRPIVGAPLIYMHVSDAERRDWRHACRHYNACGRPVHFVQVDNRNPWWDHRDEHREVVRHEEEHRDEHRDGHDHGDRRWDEGH